MRHFSATVARDAQRLDWLLDGGHNQQCDSGEHEPILEHASWEEVQQRLSRGACRDHQATTKSPPSPLAGRVVDENGEPLYAQGAAKGDAVTVTSSRAV
jgi:hypothetical protein